LYLCAVSFETDFFTALKEPNINFEEMALTLFRFQAEHVPVYRQFLELLHCSPKMVTQLDQIPFLPVSFFKSHQIRNAANTSTFYFTSSSTGGIPSQHFVPEIKIYEWSFNATFNHFYGPHTELCILGLLPSYLERTGSSLVYMVSQMIQESKYPKSNFFLTDFKALHQQLIENERQRIPTLLIGVTYALLDFANQFPVPLSSTMVMETGGMKGRRQEMQRSEIHSVLKQQFELANIHSEYGMTELLTQAYSKGNGIFEVPNWMRVFAADLNDARTLLAKDKSGSLNVIDLANIHSCAFIATDDLGIVHQNNTFEILGRKDFSDIRGCGLMYIP